MSSPSQYRIWWLNPGWAFSLALVPFSVAAYFFTNEQYTIYWRAGRFFDEGDLAFTLGCAAVFLAGGLLARLLPAGGTNVEWGKLSARELHFLLRIFQLGSILTIFGYVIWFGIAIRNGMSMDMIKDLVTGESGAAYQTHTMLTTVPGVTTATQFAMAVFIIGTILFFNGMRRKVVGWLVIILCFAILRNISHNERLAITEIAVPTVCLVAYYCRRQLARFLRGVQSLLWPIVGLLFFYLLFTASEYGRAWTTFYRDEGVYNSIWEFTSIRLIGYYVTALNNGSLCYHIGGSYDLPEATFHWFWRFPLIGPWFHALFSHNQKEAMYALLISDANPEFNNIGTPFDMALDWGEFGACLYFFFAGIAVFYFYRRFLRGNIAGLLVYPFLYTGLLEIARASYWPNSRAFPSWALLVLAIYGLRKIRIKQRRLELRQAAEAQQVTDRLQRSASVILDGPTEPVEPVSKRSD